MKLKYLSLEDKLKVLERVDSGATMQTVCIEFGVKPSTFYDIKKNRDKIRQQHLLDNGSSKVWKTLNSSNLLTWALQCLSPMNKNMLS